MQGNLPFPDLDGLEHLPPKTQARILEIRNTLTQKTTQHGPQLRIAREHALRAATRLHSLLRVAQAAAHDFVAWESSIGGKTVSVRGMWAITIALLLAGGIEAFLAFPGIRYALGDLGQIKYPWQDPLALVSALMIGLMSMLTAKFAGWNLAWAERSTMHEPEPARIRIPLFLRSLVKEDPANLPELLGESPLTSLQELDLDALDAIPPSREVQAEAERAAEEAKVEESERAAPLLQTPRSRKVHVLVAAGLIVVQLGLWTVTGVLRAAYLARMPHAGAPVSSGLLATHVSAPHAHGLSPIVVGVLIVLASWFFYLLSVGIVFALHPAAELRREQLRRRMDQANDALVNALTEVEHLGAYERLRCEGDAAGISARNAEAAARSAEPDPDYAGELA